MVATTILLVSFPLIFRTFGSIYGKLGSGIVIISVIVVLFFLSHYPDGATVDEISIWCFIEKASTMQQLTRMEAIGLVSRKKKDHQRH
jgi:hypothetical protein